MKILPILLTCISLASPVCDYEVGKLIDSKSYSNVSLCSEGKLFRENIEIKVSTGGEEIIVEPEVNIGYSPNIFVGNFLNNELDQVLYSVESGGSGGYSYYELFSFEGKKAETKFNSNDFSPKFEIAYSQENLNIIEITYQDKVLYLDASKSGCQNKEDCALYISDINTIFPYYNIALDRYYLSILQRVYGGYSANTFGYINSIVEVNEDGYKIIDMGILSNFEI